MQGYRVLIADDERPVRKLLERICAQLGWESDAVEDGDQAVKLMDSNEYQIFTVDVNMPGPSGVELARIILKRYETPAILILTGYAEVQDAVQAMKDGVYDYVQKDNVEIEDIKAYLQNAASFYENLKLNTEANKQREKSITNLEVSHKQFQALIDLSSDMIFILDVGNLEFIDCNPAACQQLCYSREELLNSAIQTVLPMFTPEFIQDHFLHSTKKKRTIEAEITSKEGNLIDVEIDLTFLCFQHGVYLGIVIRDITERKALQAEIVQERNLLHLLMNNIPDSIYFKDKQLKLFRVNQSVVSNMGLPNEKEALNKTVFDIYPKSQADYLYEQECKIVETRKSLINDEVEIILPNGIKQWFSTTKVPIINEQGEVDGIIGVSRNITKQKDAEHQIKMATQRLEVKAAEMNAILDEIEEGVISTDHSCRITQVNNWFEQLIETPKEFLIGEHINSVLKSNFGIDILPVLKNVQMENLSEKTVVKFVLHDNNYALTLKPIQMNNVFMGVICCIHNLSELIDDSVIPKTYHNNTSVIESINTPILGMVEIADQLTKTNLTDEQKSMIDTIVNCGQSVLNLMPSKELNV